MINSVKGCNIHVYSSPADHEQKWNTLHITQRFERTTANDNS